MSDGATARQSPWRALLVTGSVRRHSLNARLLAASARLAPPEATLQWAPSLASLPLYNEDAEGPPPPPPVAQWRAALQAADAVIIAMPEYNHSLPGIVKNAIDWASAPYRAPPFSAKVVGLMVATPGGAQGFLALTHAQLILGDMGNFVVATPQVVVQQAKERFVQAADGSWTLTCPRTKHFLGAQWHALSAAVAAKAGQAARAGLSFSGQDAAQP